MSTSPSPLPQPTVPQYEPAFRRSGSTWLPSPFAGSMRCTRARRAPGWLGDSSGRVSLRPDGQRGNVVSEVMPWSVRRVSGS